MVGVEEGREFRFRGDLYSQESIFHLVHTGFDTQHRPTTLNRPRHTDTNSYSAGGAGSRSIAMSASVCLSVRDRIFGTACRSSPIFCARYLWPWLGRPATAYYTSCTLPVLWMTSYEPTLLDVAAQTKRSARAALGLAINCAR